MNIGNTTSVCPICGADLCGKYEGDIKNVTLSDEGDLENYDFAEGEDITISCTTGCDESAIYRALRKAGCVPQEWRLRALNNATMFEIQAWFRRLSNHNTELQHDWSIWDYESNSWWSQERINEACKQIDKGV